MISKFTFCLFLSVIWIQISAQNEYILKANRAFELGRFESAISLYSNYPNINSDAKALTRRGIAYFNYNLLNSAIKDFTAAKKIGSSSPILYLKMAQSKQHLGAYDEAAFFYKQFLEKSEKSNPYYKLANVELKNCVFSSFHSNKRTGSLVQSFGEEVNSRYDEINAIQSPNFGNLFYFSSNRNKSDFDIYAFVLSEEGLWSTYDLTKKPFNNGYDNIALDIDPGKGNALLFQENQMSKQQTRFAAFDENGNDILISLPQEIFDGAIDITLVNRNVLVFSSNKYDGYGGYDIYSITYAGGQWGAPSNLGASINSAFDERSPFYSNNMEHFYFSSNRPYCYGGFDIYYCDLKNQKQPQNLGNSINSSGNEINFNIDAAGHMAMFSSDRKTGLGGYDLYFAYLQDVKNMGMRDSLTFEFITNAEEKYIKQVLQEDEADVKKELEENLSVLEIEENDVAVDSTEEVVDTFVNLPVIEESPVDTTKKSTIDLPASEDVLEKKDSVIVEDADQVIDTLNVNTAVNDKTVENIDEETIINHPTVTDSIEFVNTIDSLVEKETPEIESPEEVVAISKNESRFDNPMTLLYVDRQDLTTGKNKMKLDQIIKLLQNANNSILISAHTDHHELGLPEYVQYNTLKRALAVSKYLIDNGVNEDQVSIISVAYNYPLVKKDINGVEVDSIIKYNKRIDLQIFNDSDVIMQDDLLNDEKIPPFALDGKYEIYSSIRDGIYYSVEIAESKRIFKNAILRLYDDIYVGREGYNSKNKYYIGIYTQREDAEALQVELSKSSAPYAKVATFKNGKRID